MATRGKGTERCPNYRESRGTMEWGGVYSVISVELTMYIIQCEQSTVYSVISVSGRFYRFLSVSVAK